LTNPLLPSDDTLLSGLKIYRDNCAGCHGAFNRPSHWGQNNFYPRVPQFAEAKPGMTAAQMFFVVKHGIRYTGMAGWDGDMADQDIWKVVTFLENLDKLPAPVATAWKENR
jgi:mono/diheme cytochrome c family protein